jgi:lipopolysaccharide transport system ATP-binding protein
MYLRLAFAVAAHLESEILLVDEVLAVGDVHFQKRCLQKMNEVARAGRTVLFVSHNLQAIKTLCTRAILLDEGRLQADGDVSRVTSAYLTRNDQVTGDGVIPGSAPRIVGTGEARLRRVALRDADGRSVRQVFFGQPLRIGMLFEVKTPLRGVALEVGISTSDGFRVATATSLDGGRPALNLEPGLWEVRGRLAVVLQPGQYAIDVMLHHWDTSKLTIDWVERALTFAALDVSAVGPDHYVCFATEYTLLHVRGFVRPDSTWEPPVSRLDTEVN